MILRTALIVTVIAMLIAVSDPPQSPTISGPATVIDGDTIVVGRSTHVRLWGMDAPELNQRCTDDKGAPFNCGELAASVLEEEIGGATVVCFPLDTDRYHRIVAVCTARDHDLGEAMVKRGFAIDYQFFSRGRYRGAEDEARKARRGLWAGAWQEPREWRRENRR